MRAAKFRSRHATSDYSSRCRSRRAISASARALHQLMDHGRFTRFGNERGKPIAPQQTATMITPPARGEVKGYMFQVMPSGYHPDRRHFQGAHREISTIWLLINTVKGNIAWVRETQKPLLHRPGRVLLKRLYRTGTLRSRAVERSPTALVAGTAPCRHVRNHQIGWRTALHTA